MELHQCFSHLSRARQQLRLQSIHRDSECVALGQAPTTAWTTPRRFSFKKDIGRTLRLKTQERLQDTVFTDRVSTSNLDMKKVEHFLPDYFGRISQISQQTVVRLFLNCCPTILPIRRVRRPESFEKALQCQNSNFLTLPKTNPGKL